MDSLTHHRFFSTTLLAAFAVVALLSVACREKTSFLTIVEQTPYLGLDPTVRHISCFNVARLKGRDEFRQFKRDALWRDKLGPLLNQMANRTSLKPLDRIDLLILASSGRRDALIPLKNTVFVARGRFEGLIGQLDDLRNWLGEEFLIAPPAFMGSAHPGTEFRTYHLAAKSQFNERIRYDLYVCLVSDSLLVFSLSQHQFNRTLNVMGGLKEGLQADGDWMALLQHPNIGATIWGAGYVSSPWAAGIAAGVPSLQNLPLAKRYFYDVEFYQNKIDAEIGLICETIDSATALTPGLRAAIEPIVGWLGTLSPIPTPIAVLPRQARVQTELNISTINLVLSGQVLSGVLYEWAKLNDARIYGAATP